MKGNFAKIMKFLCVGEDFLKEIIFQRLPVTMAPRFNMYLTIFIGMVGV